MKRLVAGLAIGVVFAAAAGARSDERTLSVDNQGDKVIVRGCVSEDGCAIDYRRGDKWVVKLVTP